MRAAIVRHFSESGIHRIVVFFVSTVLLTVGLVLTMFLVPCMQFCTNLGL